MQILARTFLMAVGLLSVYSLPNLASRQSAPVDGIYELLLAQMRTALLDMRAMTPAESVCASHYNNRTQQLNNQLTNQTNACFDSANSTTWVNNKNANQTVAQMRINMQKVQQQLANCSALTNVPLFLNCTTASFDNNLLLLDQTNTQAYQVQAEIAANQSQVDIVRQACINAAISSAKTNLTKSANEYNQCLTSATNQRYVHSMPLLN